MAECTYLGHIVGSGIVKPQPSKVLAVESFGTPKTKSQVRAFLGLTGYYRRFVHNYATLASPLTDLTRKSAPEQVEWTAECERVFRQLKTQLCCYPVLRSPDFNKEFVLQTDASNRGIGAVLSQRDAGGGENPIYRLLQQKAACCRAKNVIREGVSCDQAGNGGVQDLPSWAPFHR